MNQLEKLRAERETEISAAKALAKGAQDAGRDLGDEEATQIEAHTAKATDLRSQIDAEEAKERKRLSLLAALDDEAGHEMATQPVIVRPSVNDGHSKPKIVKGEGSGRWAHFGEYCFKVREAASQPSLIDRRLIPEAAAPGMRTDVDSTGGFLIPDEYRAGMIERLYTQGEILARIKAAGMYMSLSGNTLKIPYVDETSRATGSRFGGVRGYWAGETDAITDSKPKVGRMLLHLNKAGCVGYVTDEMLEDAPAAGQFLERAFTNELIFTVEDAIVNGDGAGKPVGLTTAGCAISTTKVTNQTAATIWGDNITSMWSHLWAGSRQKAVWLVNQSCEPSLFSLTLAGRFGSASTDVDGIPLFYPAGSLLNQGKYSLLMGRPVIPVEYCSYVGTLGDIILFDPSQYVLVDKRGGVNMASSIHVRFLTDEQTFRFTYRVDGQVAWPSAVTAKDATNTLSPVVLLAARA